MKFFKRCLFKSMLENCQQRCKDWKTLCWYSYNSIPVCVLLTVWDQSVSSLWHFHFAFMYFLFFSFLINPVRHKASFFYLEFWSSSTLPSTVQLAVNMLNKSVGNVKNLEKCFKIKLSCFVSSCQFLFIVNILKYIIYHINKN